MASGPVRGPGSASVGSKAGVWSKSVWRPIVHHDRDFGLRGPRAPGLTDVAASDVAGLAGS